MDHGFLSLTGSDGLVYFVPVSEKNNNSRFLYCRDQVAELLSVVS